MEKVKTVSFSEIEECFVLKAKLDATQSEIENRIRYIIDFLAKVLKVHDYEDYSLSWYFECAEEGEIGNPWDAIYDSKVHIVIDHPYFKGACLLLSQPEYRGLTWDFFDGMIPISWLTDDFEEEVIKARQAYLDFCADQKRKKQEKKQEKKKEKLAIKEDLIKKIKSKLTDEELKALNLKK